MPSTHVSIRSGQWHINDLPTHAGKSFRGMSLQGLLFNSRMVQGIFDDLNPQTRERWSYPDGPWDADRNTREFVAAMSVWRGHGLDAFTINLQGGSPEGYSKSQPWINSAIADDGALRDDYLDRLSLILDESDRLGMVVILGLFYFGQANRLQDDATIFRAVDGAVQWLMAQGRSNVVIEIANECNIIYTHDLIKPTRTRELIERVREKSGGRLLVSTSFSGGARPTAEVVDASDFVLFHGNGVKTPDDMRKLVLDIRHGPTYRDQPIVCNEDDHFDFDLPDNHFLATVESGASWGYFDFRKKDEPFEQGFQSVPVDWGINSPRKRGFFELLKAMTA